MRNTLQNKCVLVNSFFILSKNRSFYSEIIAVFENTTVYFKKVFK